MATSGTYAFALSANQLVQAALRQTGRFGMGDTIPPADINNCLQALNIIIKTMVKNQLPLWCVQQVVVPLVANQQTYNLSAITGQTRPLRVTNGFIRSSDGGDVQLTLISRSDWNSLGRKAAPGIPNQAYYDPQLGAGLLYLYDCPLDASHTVYLDVQRQIQDVNLLTESLDFPQEAFHMLKWELADEIALEYLTPADIRNEISKKAAIASEHFFANERENVSTYFTPSERNY